MINTIMFKGTFTPQILKHTLLAVFVLCFSVGFNLQAQAQNGPIECTFIDNFANTTEVSPAVELTPMNPGPIDIVDDGSPGVLGTFRNITFGPLMGIIDATINIENDLFSLSNGAATTAPVSISYSANGAGLNADLTNTTLIRYLLAGNDLPNTASNLTITDSSNNSANILIPNLPNNADGDLFPQILDFVISDFNGIESLNLSNIKSIELEITPSMANVDIVIGAFELCQPPTRDVPTLSEWGLIAMAGVLGVISFMVMRRKSVTT